MALQSAMAMEVVLKDSSKSFGVFFENLITSPIMHPFNNYVIWPGSLALNES